MQRARAGSATSIIESLLESRNLMMMACKGRPTPEQQERFDKIDADLRTWREQEIKESETAKA